MTKQSSEFLAKIAKVFPLKSLAVNDEISLRPLASGDLDRLCELLTGDPEMTWTRRQWTDENVAFLLNLRIEHYKDFGFGVYAVVMDGELIGMSGLQTWDFDDDAVEIITYIGRKYWGSGIATVISEWVIQRLKKEGMTSLFAATRHENLAAIQLVENLGFERIGVQDRYGVPAITWRLDF